jgi:hypothetical protein
MFEFFIKEENIELSNQIQRNKICSIRIGKITSVLYEKRPSDLIPFKGDFPLVNVLDKMSFLDRTMKYHLFDECENDIKLAVYKAEKILFLHNSFKNFLFINSISEKDFKSKNPKIKQDILYKWLFKNKMDIGALEI